MNKDNIVKIFKTHFKINWVDFLALIFANIVFGSTLTIYNKISYEKNILFLYYFSYFPIILHSFLRIPIKKNEKELYLSSGCKRNEINFVMFAFQFLSSLILLISYFISSILFLNILKFSTIEYFSLNFRNFSIFVAMTFLLSTISFNTKLSVESNKKWFLKEYIELLFVALILVFMFFIVDNIPSFEIKLNVLISIAVYFLSIIISYIIGKEFMNKKDFI